MGGIERIEVRKGTPREEVERGVEKRRKGGDDDDNTVNYMHYDDKSVDKIS